MKPKSPRKPVTPPSMIRSMLRRAWMWSRERKAALKRDGNSCVACGYDKGLEVHHIHGINWDRIMAVLYEELFCHPDKLRTLCKYCHAAQEPHETALDGEEVK
jgi:5-methylcytosine-specific restriction endonuclease McrA